MKILSIDVGIKNLAFCLFEKEINTEHFKVIKWDTVNLSQEETFKCMFIEKNILCNKPAKFKKNNSYYCLKHSKKQVYNIPTLQQKHSFINKQNLLQLQEIANNYGIQYSPKIKKTNLIALINEHISNNYFELIEEKKANEVNMYDIGLNIKTKFNELFKDESKIDYVIIENQIGPLAIRMKTIQGMIVQYFIMSHLEVSHIEFISSANKLKDAKKDDSKKDDSKKEDSKKEDTKDNSYSDRKKKGIEKCLGILTKEYNYNEHISYFNSHKKKDDLADSFLQGLWFIHTKVL